MTRRLFAILLFSLAVLTAGVADAGRGRGNFTPSQPSVTTSEPPGPTTPIPEPSALILYALGAGIAIWAVRRQARR